MNERLVPAALAALFLALGCFVLDLPGVQADEALFASVLFEPKASPVGVRLLFGSVPAMCYPYIGTLKSGIFAVIWRFFEPSAATVHFPALVIGATSVYIFARLLQRLSQPIWAAVLLATDATYLMTTRSDWGPVALQHLLGLAGVYAGVRYAQTTQLKWVAAAGFLFGLGFDQTCSGGSLVYNYKTGGNSFKGKSSLETSSVWPKAEVFWHSLGNENVFGAGTARALAPVEPTNPFAAAVSRFDFTFPILPWEFAVGLLTAPWLWRSPLYRFGIAALASGYGYMLLLNGAGNSLHHTVLVWTCPI